MFDWNDLRHFLAVAREGSTLGAARALSVSQSTVQRRVAELERRIGRRLVVRSPAGYRLTELGKALRPLAESVEEAVIAFERKLAADSETVAGTIRVTCPEPLVVRITGSPLLDRLRARHPGLSVEFVMSDRFLDLARGEADVAIRAGESTDKRLVGRKLADSPWAVYASRAYVARNGTPISVSDLDRHNVIGFGGDIADHRAARWMREVAPRAGVAARNDSIPGLVYAVKSGVGIAPLPVALAESEDGLVRVLGPLPELATNWYLLTHADLRQTLRVHAFFEFIAEERKLVRQILLGAGGKVDLDGSQP